MSSPHLGSISYSDSTEFNNRECYKLCPQPAQYYWFVNDLGAILEKIRDLEKGQVEDEDSRPSEHAIQACHDVLLGALTRFNAKSADAPRPFPDGSVTTDDDGRLTIEWRQGEAKVMLRIPGLETGKAFLYYSRDDSFGAEELTSESLAHRLFSLL